MGQRIAAVGVEEESIAAAVERKRSRSESVVLGEVVERVTQGPVDMTTGWVNVGRPFSFCALSPP